MADLNEIEKFISEFPIYQYGFLKPEDVDFSDELREYCKESCRRYNSNWSCPPAVPKISKCRKRCMQYDDLFVFSTVSRIKDITNRNLRLESLGHHEQLTIIIEEYLRKNGYELLTLTSDACSICKKCAFPVEYCKFPEEMHPCIESYGIVISKLAKKAVMDYDMGEKLCMHFSLLFLKNPEDKTAADDTQSESAASTVPQDTREINV